MRLSALSVPVLLVQAFSAGPSSAAVGVVRTDVWVRTRTATALEICARGWVDDGPATGVWARTVAGTVVVAPDVLVAPAYAESCFWASSTATPVGGGLVSLTFTGGGTGGDVAGACGLTFGWAPGVPINEINGFCTDAA
jgi:hypothetical protein